MCCELENFTLKKLYGVNLYWHFIKSNQVVEHIHNYLIVSCKKLKIISFASSKMKNIGVFPTCFKFPVKLICCRAFGSPSSACYLLQTIAIILYNF